MVDKNRRAALAIVLAAAGCVAMAWVEGVLRPVYPVKSALKIAVFLGCAGLYALFSRDFAPFRIFRRPRQIKLAALLAAGVLPAGWLPEEGLLEAVPPPPQAAKARVMDMASAAAISFFIFITVPPLISQKI